MSKYHRMMPGPRIDVYDVLVGFNVTCPARAHAIKKLLAAGQRGAKDEEQDLREAVQSVNRSIGLLKHPGKE